MKLEYSPLCAVLFLVIAVSGCTQYGGQQAQQPAATVPPPVPVTSTTTTPVRLPATTVPPPTTAPVQSTTTTTKQPASAVIQITASGFTPRTITINAGGAVTFVNKDTTAHWPASDVHPTHAAYPESGGCIGSTFDACRGLAQDEVFSFAFNRKGTWTYHDHLNPDLTGTIVVQ